METKLIFNSFLAKQLLSRGHQIIDLLKDHKRKDGVVFVFKETEKFKMDLKELTAK